MEIVLGVCLATGLAAACGFRVFVPPLVLGLAARLGWLGLSSTFEWMGSTPALVTFGVATVLEIAAYYVPWLDNTLDTIASPAAVLAGVTVAAAAMAQVDPWIQWPVAIIAGAGSAGVTQTGSVVARAGSSLTTAGLANPVVSTVEWVSALVLSFLSVLLPVLAVLLVLGVLVLALRAIRRRSRARARA